MLEGLSTRFYIAQVTDVTGTTVTLATPFGTSIPVGAILRRLVLAKMVSRYASFDFKSPRLAILRMDWEELCPEESVPEDETIGTDLGKLPTRCYLYDLSWELDGETFYERLTSFESDITFSSNAYTSANVSHGEINQGLFLDNDKTELTITISDSDTVKKMANLTMEAPVFLTIRKADWNDGAAENDSVIFFGELTTPNVNGFIAKASAVPGGTKFDRGIPRVGIQRDCNNAIFDAGCALDKDDWKWTTTVYDPGDPGYPFTFTLDDPGGLTDLVDDYFAGGWIEFGAGATFQRRSILRSTAPSGGYMDITIDRDPLPYPGVGDTVALRPGCDGLYGTCIGKFDNQLNFLGFPFLPAANPSLVKKNQTSAGGKK